MGEKIHVGGTVSTRREQKGKKKKRQNCGGCNSGISKLGGKTNGKAREDEVLPLCIPRGRSVSGT